MKRGSACRIIFRPANRLAQQFGGVGQLELFLDVGTVGLNCFHADVHHFGDELVIHGGVDGLPNCEVIVALQNFPPSGIQRAVASKNARAAGLPKTPGERAKCRSTPRPSQTCRRAVPTILCGNTYVINSELLPCLARPFHVQMIHG